MDPETSEKKLHMITHGTLMSNEAQLQGRLKMELKQHQVSMINAMKTLEQKAVVMHANTELHTHVGICGDDVGTGKSLSVLGLISEFTTIKHRTKYYKTTPFFSVSQQTDRVSMQVNVIVVPHSIHAQWVHYIEQHTYLTYYAVSRKAHIMNVKNIRPVDILLISSTMYNAFMTFEQNNATYFRRVIFDEADSIRIPASKEVDAQFIWLITSSLENVMFPSGRYYVQKPGRGISLVHVMGINGQGFVNEMMRVIGNSHVSVLEKMVLKNNPEFAKRSLGMHTPKKHYIMCKTPLYMRIISGSVQQNVIEMLNSGDTDRALEYLGCKYETHDTIVSVVTESIRTEMNDIDLELTFTQQRRMYNEEERRAMTDRLLERKGRLKTRLESIQEEIEHYKDRTCPICWDDFKTPVCTLTCCNKMFCLECVVQCRSCPLCRQRVTNTDLIVVDTVARPRIAEEKKSKSDNLVDILRSRPDGKFLIFSNSDATFDTVTNTLTNINITSSKLYGNASVIGKRIMQFNSGEVQVLLLNPQYYGCGLNLEQTTDIIFFHRFENEMERQIIGRAQRHGRTSVLDVHYLYYENEFHA